MIKTKNKKLIPFCMMTMLILTGCEDFMNNFQKKDDNDPPTVKIKVENPNPTISTTQTFSAKVSDPNKGDLVTVTWSVSSGDLSTTTGENVQWTAPFDTMIVQVSAIARDDKNNAARDEVSIHVGNSPPHISKFNSSSSHVISGNSIVLSCTATDPEEGEISYHFYDVEMAGIIEHTNKQASTAKWISPENIGQADMFHLVVEASDPLGFIGADTLEILVYSDFGTIWVVDNGHKQVTKYTANGIKIFTVAETFKNPVAVVSNVDEPYGCFIADQEDNTVYKIDSEGNAIDSYSNIPFVSDIAMHNSTRKIWALSYEGDAVTIIDGITGNTEKKITGFNQPTSIEINQKTGDVWILEEGNNRVIQLDAGVGTADLPDLISDKTSIIFKNGYNAPHHLCLINTKDGQLASKVYITDMYDDQIERLILKDNIYEQLAPVDLLYPTPSLVGSIYLNLKSMVFVVNTMGNMEVFEEENILEKKPITGSYAFVRPSAMIVDDQSGECWIGDNGTNQLVKIKINGDFSYTLLRKIGGFLSIKDIAINK